jgi:hypothetical protein
MSKLISCVRAWLGIRGLLSNKCGVHFAQFEGLISEVMGMKQLINDINLVYLCFWLLRIYAYCFFDEKVFIAFC